MIFGGKSIFISRACGLLLCALTLASCGEESGARKRQLSLLSSEEDSLAACETAAPAETPLRQLTRREISNVVLDVFGASVQSAALNAINAIPVSKRTWGFDNSASGSSNALVESLLNLGELIGQKLVQTNSPAFGISSCLATTADASCIRTVIESLGGRLFRKPLASAQTDLYAALFTRLLATSRADAMVAVIAAMVASPHFIHLTEIDGSPMDPGGSDLSKLKLTPHEVAARLSFAYTGSIPDAALFEAARNGELATAEQRLTQAKRLLLSPRGRKHMNTFFEQYLGLSDIPELNYPSSFLEGQSTAGLDQALPQELLDYMNLHTIDQEGLTFQNLMTSSQSVVKNAGLASLYKISASTRVDGQVEFSDPRRRGLLTKAAMLIYPEVHANGFRRGHVIKERFLCQSLERPDPETLPEAFNQVPTGVDLTTRQKLQAMTSSPACMTCHQALNHYGFAFEEFDSLGRLRTVEKFFSATGTVINALPIDTQTLPQLPGQNAEAVGGAAELGELLGRNAQAAQCFSKQWYDFSLARRSSAGSCAAKTLARTSTSAGQGISAMYLDLVQLPEFPLRVRPKQ